jgi:hypothetical protein
VYQALAKSGAIVTASQGVTGRFDDVHISGIPGNPRLIY